MRSKKLLSLLLALCLMVTLLPMTASASEAVTRLAGANRYETAVKVADQMKEALGVKKFDAVILANGYNFADALSGSYLAAVKNAPILLTWNGDSKYDYLNEYTVEYVKENLAEGGTVYILGGTSAVPASIDAKLEGYNVVRMDGANRFETNIMILEEAGVQPGQEILVCTATNFADSLSGSAVGLPILLVYNEYGKLTDDQNAYLTSLNGKNTFCILGGESAISANLANAIASYGTTTRLAGANRFETSVLVAEKYFPDAESAVLAYAWDFPDGLCGGSLAYAMDVPLILTMPKYEMEATEYVNSRDITTGTVLGGTSLISDKAVDLIFTRNPVSDAYHSHAPSYEVDGGVPYYIPRVDLAGDMAAEVNNTIYNDLKGYINSDMNISYDRGMNYLWARKDSIVSILVLAGEDYNTAVSQFYVYNVSTETGERLPNSALWEAYGLSETEYYNRLKENLDAHYGEWDYDSKTEWERTQRENTYSTENLEAAMPYVGVNGDLCVVVKIYSPAGPDLYYLYNLTGTATPKRPPHDLHDESICTGNVSAQSPYQQFLENGCFCRNMEAGDMIVGGYAILDINGDGVKELIIDTRAWRVEEFHNHLIYTLNEQGQIEYVDAIYTFTCLYYSEEQHAMGYLDSRGDSSLNYATFEDGVIQKSYGRDDESFHGIDWIEIQ